ncbi:hypothetical protein ACN47A_39340 [Myxococcus fulvus]|uniref:hypothetical protein n=1 Tax=Myxococcus fulvus TaxID=33 RepID=UPI003B9BEDBD
MNSNPLCPPRRLSSVPLALLLLLAACGGEDGTLRVIRDGKWADFDHQRRDTLSADEEARLVLCGSDTGQSQEEDVGISACIHIPMDKALLGTGPRTLQISGTSYVKKTETVPAYTFTPREGNSPELRAVWVQTSCFERPDPLSSDVMQLVHGQLVLEENSATRLRGRLVLKMEGVTYGPCYGGGAEAELDFDASL